MIGNLVRRLVGGERRAALPVQASDWGDWIGVRSAAGVNVSPAAAMSLSTVQACVALIARSLASVPLVLYRRTADGGREPAEDHPLYPILHDLANPLQTAFDVRLALFASVLLYGNGYAEIEWGEDGYPRALWPLPPEQVQVYVTADRRLLYQVSGDVFGVSSRVRWLSDDRMHHVRGLTTHGLLGLSPLRAANAVGLAMATEEFGARYFGDGAHPSIVLSHPAKLSNDAVKNLRASFEAQWAGMSNAHRVAVVGEGVKPEAMRISPDESQFLETRAFQVAEICRIFNVSPGLVGAAETQTYASAEQDLIRFRELTLGPWAKSHREALQRDLLTDDERQDYFIQYKLSALQATDLKTRFEAHQIGLLTGFETQNEVRLMEDMNPVPGGDTLWRPLNMTTVADDQQEDQPQEQQEPDRNDDDDGAAAALRAAWVADVQRRLTARIANDVRQQGAKVLRTGSRLALSEWGEGQQHEWRLAGEEMLCPLRQAQGAQAQGTDALAPNVADWVATAYQAAAGELIGHE